MSSPEWDLDKVDPELALAEAIGRMFHGTTTIPGTIQIDRLGAWLLLTMRFLRLGAAEAGDVVDRHLDRLLEA